MIKSHCFPQGVAVGLKYNALTGRKPSTAESRAISQPNATRWGSIVIAILLAFPTISSAQQQHEFSAYVGGGRSSLFYDPNAGYQKNGFGAMGGVGYSFFFNDKWAVVSGVEFARYNAKLTLDNYRETYDAYDDFDYTDPELQQFRFTAIVSDYSEKQSAVMLQIPIIAQFSFGKNEKVKAFVAVGGKGGVSLDARSKGEIPTLQTNGYYYYEGQSYSNSPEGGFYQTKGEPKESDLDLRTSIFLSIESGINIKLRDNMPLYVSVFFDYGVKDIAKSGSEKFVDYNNSTNTSEFPINSAVETGIIDRINPLAVGLKVKFAFRKGIK